MAVKDKWAFSTSEEDEVSSILVGAFAPLIYFYNYLVSDDIKKMKVAPSKYAPVVETSLKKGRKRKQKTPPSVNNRFPGGGFALRMKKLMENVKQNSGGRRSNERSKTHLRSSTSTSRRKGSQRKKTANGGGLPVECVLKESQQPKVEGGGECFPEVDKEEDFVIESFDSQELLQDVHVRTVDEVESRSRKVGGIKEIAKSKGETGKAKIDGPHSKAGSSKTVVINSQPEFAPSQLDAEKRRVLDVKPKESKLPAPRLGILKKLFPSPNEPFLGRDSSTNSSGVNDDKDLSMDAVAQEEEQGRLCETMARKSSNIDKGDRLQDPKCGLEHDGVAVEGNKEQAEDGEAGALEDFFSDYDVEDSLED